MSARRSAVLNLPLPVQWPLLVSPAGHFIEDSLIASMLVLAPLILPLSPVLSVLAIVGGIFLAVYNGLTDRPGSLWPLLDERTHRVLDLAGIAILVVAPWFFAPGINRDFVLILAMISLVLALITDTTPDPRAARPFIPRLTRWLVTTTLSLGATAAGLLVVSRALRWAT